MGRRAGAAGDAFHLGLNGPALHEPPRPRSGSIRVAAGLRIDDAAALCGVSVDLLSRLENGRSGVSSARLLAVLDALGLALLVLEKARLPLVGRALVTRAAPPAP